MTKTNHRQRRQRGFTLIELMVVVTIIGILAGVAIVQVRQAQQKARETALKADLHELRKAIDDFYADKQRFPNDLNELVPQYLRKLPNDPITNAADWDTVSAAADTTGQDPQSADPNAAQNPGIIDVKSKASGKTLDNVPYSDL